MFEKMLNDRPTSEEMMAHPYFAGLDFSLVEEGLIPRKHPLRFQYSMQRTHTHVIRR